MVKEQRIRLSYLRLLFFVSTHLHGEFGISLFVSHFLSVSRVFLLYFQGEVLKNIEEFENYNKSKNIQKSNQGKSDAVKTKAFHLDEKKK